MSPALEDFQAAASRSGGVVLGRGGAIVLAGMPGALHVHLGGDRKARVERVREWQGVARQAAAHSVKINDRARRDYVRSAYGVDGDNPHLYHLMVDAIAPSTMLMAIPAGMSTIVRVPNCPDCEAS